MSIFLALAVGYAIGARSGKKEIDQLGRSLKALFETDEFMDVLSAGRAQVGHVLREVAAVMDGAQQPSESNGDLVAQVRHLVGRE